MSPSEWKEYVLSDSLRFKNPCFVISQPLLSELYLFEQINICLLWTHWRQGMALLQNLSRNDCYLDITRRSSQSSWHLDCLKEKGPRNLKGGKNIWGGSIGWACLDHTHMGFQRLGWRIWGPSWHGLNHFIEENIKIAFTVSSSVLLLFLRFLYFRWNNQWLFESMLWIGLAVSCEKYLL